MSRDLKEMREQALRLSGDTALQAKENSKYRTAVTAHLVCSRNSKDASWAAGE